jgi:hypothetical protein
MCRDSKKSWCGSRGVGYASKGNEGTKVKGETCKPLSLLDGGVQQLEDGTCIYESRTSNLSKKGARGAKSNSGSCKKKKLVK